MPENLVSAGWSVGDALHLLAASIRPARRWRVSSAENLNARAGFGARTAAARENGATGTAV